LRDDFTAALADNLNLAGALAALFGFVREVNVAIEAGLGAGDRERVEAALADVDRVLGALDPEQWKAKDGGEEDAEEITRLVHERDEARRRRDFAASDRLRDELAGRGILLEDTPQGTRWKRKS